MAMVYWLGWRSPWARADMRVTVEMPDAPKAGPIVPVVTPPVIRQSDPITADTATRIESDGLRVGSESAASGDAPTSVEDEQPVTRRRHRRPRKPVEDEIKQD